MTDGFTPREGTGWGTNKCWINGRWMRTAQCLCGAHSESMSTVGVCPLAEVTPSLPHGMLPGAELRPIGSTASGSPATVTGMS